MCSLIIRCCNVRADAYLGSCDETVKNQYWPITNQQRVSVWLYYVVYMHEGDGGERPGGGGWAYSIRLFSPGMSSCSPSFFLSLALPYYRILHCPSLFPPTAPPSITFSIPLRRLSSFLSSRPCPTHSSLPHISLSPLLLLLGIRGTQCTERRRSVYGDLCLLW